MKSNYPFLKRNQQTEEEKQRNNINSLWNQLGSMGFVGRQSFFTGYGEDGRLQPNRPTGVLNTSQGPKTVHEGEPVEIAEDGSFSVRPASQSGYPQMSRQTLSFDNGQGVASGYVPASQLGGQKELENTESVYGMEGYAEGTPDTIISTKQSSTVSDDTYKPFQTRGLQRLERYASGTDPTNTAIRNATREEFAGQSATAKGSLSQELSQAGMTGSAANTEQFMLGRQIGAQESDVMKKLRENESAQAFSAAQQLPGAAASARASEQSQQSLNFTERQWKDTEGQRMLTDAVVMDEATWLARHPGTTSGDYAKARDEATLNQKNYGLSARQVGLSERQWVDTEGQRMLTDALVMSADTWLATHPGKTLDDYKAARAEATLNQQDMELEARKYGDTEAWKEYEAAISAGDFERAAAKYFEITSREIDMTQMKQYQDYLNQKQQQELLSGDITIDAQRLGVSSDRLQAFANAVNQGANLEAANAASGLNLSLSQYQQIRRDYTAAGREQALILGDKEFQSLTDRINAGATVDMINNEFKTGFTEEEFQQLKNATVYGQTQWGRNLTMAGMLLQTQDPTNMQEAAKIYEDLFPGVTFDMTQLIKDVGAEKVAQGLSDIATIASTFDNWLDAIDSIEGLNIPENLGLKNTGDVYDIFNALKVNTIDEEWSAIEDSDYYQNLLKTDPDSAKLMQDTFSAGLTGELEFDITPTYKVLDANGKLIKSFDNIKDAEAFRAENAGSSIEEGKNYIYKNISTGDTVVVNNNGEDITDEMSSSTDKYNAFIDSVPEGEEVPAYSVWKESGQPANYDKYESIKGNVSTTTALDEIDYEKYNELLVRENSDKVFEAWNNNSTDFKGSKYFYDIPTDPEYLSKQMSYWTDDEGGKHTDISQALLQNFTENVGKMIEVPAVNEAGYSTGNEMIHGQLKGAYSTPKDSFLEIRMEDGTLKIYPFYLAGTSGDLASNKEFTAFGTTYTYDNEKQEYIKKQG